MSQRIMTGISIAMAVCGFIVVGMVWSMMQESQAFNLQMLEQFKLAQEKSASETAGDLHAIQFQLVQEGSNGKPAVGFEGKLVNYEGDKAIFTVEAISDETGLLDFGKLPWGEYALNLSAPWGEAPQPEQITTIPGRKYERTIVCPAHVPEEVEVKFQVNWQNMPEDKDYFLLCDFRTIDFEKSTGKRSFKLTSYQDIQGQRWAYRHDLEKASERSVFLIDLINERAAPCPLTADGKFENLEFQKLNWHPTVEILQGIYYSLTVYLLQKSDLEQLVSLNPMIATKTISFDSLKVNLSTFPLPFNGVIVSPFKQLEIDPALVADKSPSELKQVHGFLANSFSNPYSATDTEPNVWELIIPDLFPITGEY